MTQQERRQYSRKTLNPLPYINLPSGNGGIVLDVSERGLCFRAMAPVQKSGPIEFSFTARSKLVCGTGELVWVDRAKKMGGLRFTDLPYSALEQIRELPCNENLRPVFGKDMSLHISASDAPQPARANRRGALSAFASGIAAGLNRLLPESLGSKLRETWLPPLRNSLARLRARFPVSGLQNQNRWLVQASCAAFLGIMILTWVSVRHRQTGELLIRLGTKLSGQTAALAPAVASPGPRVDDGAADQSKIDVPVAQALSQSEGAAAATVAKQIPAAAPAPQIQAAPANPPKQEIRRGDLVVQVAALTQEADARQLTEKLRQENFQAFVGTFPADSYYRVMLGPYADAASARVVLGKLKKAGFSSFIRRESDAERVGWLRKPAPRQEPAT